MLFVPPTLLLAQILTASHVPLNYHQSLPRHQPFPGNGNSNGLPSTISGQNPIYMNTSSSGTGPPRPSAFVPHQRPSSSSTYYTTATLAAHSRSKALSPPTGPPAASTLQPQQRQFDSYYYHPATLKANSNALPLPQRHPQGTLNNGRPAPTQRETQLYANQQPQPHVVYADLALPSAGSGSGSCAEAPRGTDYAVLKFNKAGIGKEIDV